MVRYSTMSDTVPALSIEHVSKSYGSSTALDDINMTVEQGAFFGFLGPNGAGKSTTIHLITGIARLTKGRIRVFGTDVNTSYREARTKVGLSPQEFNVDIFEKVDNILDFVAGYYGLHKALRKERVDELLERFNLEKHRRKEFRMLSGGLKRRVLLARAMVHKPKLLILDEPTAGVDVELRRELWKYLRELNEDGTTILLTSHYLEEVELLCDRIAMINQGKIVVVDDKEAFTQNGGKLEDKYLELTAQNTSTS